MRIVIKKKDREDKVEIKFKENNYWMNISKIIFQRLKPLNLNLRFLVKTVLIASKAIVYVFKKDIIAMITVNVNNARIIVNKFSNLETINLKNWKIN